MTGAELADELSVIAAAYRSDARVAWQIARFVNANMAAILAALRSERAAVDERAVERAARAIEGPHDHRYVTPEKLSELREIRWSQLKPQKQGYRRIQARAALAAAQEGSNG